MPCPIVAALSCTLSCTSLPGGCSLYTICVPVPAVSPSRPVNSSTPVVGVADGRLRVWSVHTTQHNLHARSLVYSRYSKYFMHYNTSELTGGAYSSYHDLRCTVTMYVAATAGIKRLNNC